jgi:hypothetical protein
MTGGKMNKLFVGTQVRRTSEKYSAAAQSVGKRIERVIGYHDTVVVSVNDLSVLLKVEGLLRSALFKKWLNNYHVKKFNRAKGDRQLIRCKVRMTQPSRNLLLKLDEILKHSHYRVIRVDTTYDFVLGVGDDAEDVEAFFKSRCVLKRTSAPPCQYENTSYFCGKPERGQKLPSENIVVYQNKMFTFNGDKNVHVERRRQNKHAVERAVIHTLRDLAHYDFGERIKDDLSMCEVTNKSQVGKALLMSSSLRKNISEKSGLREFNKRLKEEQFLAQKIWIDCKGGRQYLKPISIKSLLPVLDFGEDYAGTV